MLATGTYWLVCWSVLFGYYLLLADQLKGPEFLVGAVATTLACGAIGIVRRAGALRFRPRLSWVARIRHLPGRILLDCSLVGLALAQRLFTGRCTDGAFHSIPFDPGGDDPTSAARRALVIAGLSVAPNTFVVDIEPERGTILIHQLTGRGPPDEGDRKWPI
jgi:multisubunit Na+/H+ antiporter MnhE subunit